MIQFFAISLTLLSAAFSLGGVANLYLRYRTRVLRLMLLFLLSLLCISTGVWLGTEFFADYGLSGVGLLYIMALLQLVGIGINIFILPHLVSTLVLIPIPRFIQPLLWGWNSVYIVLAISSFVFPAFSASPVTPL
jgi:hypothetical protein